MVFLTFVNMVRQVMSRPDKFWRKEMCKRMAWHMYGRKRNCYMLSIRYVRRALRYSSQSRDLKKQNLRELWALRINAACGEHDIEMRSFRTALVESEVALNTKMLADLAIYEPRTFGGLVEFAKRRNEALGISADGQSPPSGVFTRGML